MLKTLLRVRMAALLAAFSGQNKRKTRTKGKAVGYAFLMLYCFCAFTFLFYTSFSQLAAAFFPLGLGWLYFAMFAIMAFALMFIGSVFTAKSQLFEAKDNELLLSMPVKPGMILLSRMAALLVMNFVFELVVALPVLVAWLRYGSVSGAGVLSFIVIVLALPLFSLAVSCLFAWLISLITSRMRNTTVVTMVLSVVFLLAYFAFCFRMNAYVTTLAANGQTIAGALSAAVPSPASSQVKPAYCRCSRMRSRMRGSSSTIRILAIGMPSLYVYITTIQCKSGRIVKKNKTFIKMFAYIRVLPCNFKERHPFCKTCCNLPLYAVQ